MRNELTIWSILAVLSIVLFSGCAQVKTKPVLAPVSDAPVVVDGTPLRLNSARIAPGAQPVARRLSVYFPTASTTVSDASVIELRKTARFLRNHPSVSVSLIGNCDERGSYAYNQRLGARRAESVAKVLTEAGVPAARLSTRSNGEFKPLLKCHVESCWSVNRRVDVIYGGW